MNPRVAFSIILGIAGLCFLMAAWLVLKGPPV